MADNGKYLIAEASRRLLRPLVRILLRHGISYGDFAEVVKSVYVDVARTELTPDGKRPTDSRAAIVTGLTRKDVKRLREALQRDDSQIEWGGNRATRVLAGWHRDPDFTDHSGAPARLSLDDDKQGLPALVRRYSGDMPISAMLEELLRVGAVERDEAGGVIVHSRSYLPDAGDPEGLRMLGSATHDLLATIEHNLNLGETGGQPYLQRVAFNNDVDARALPVFRRLVAEHGQQFLELLDDWLTAHEVDSNSENKQAVRAGVGIYFFDDQQGPGGKP